MDSNRQINAKRLAAVIGGGAVIAMGALSMAIHQEQAGPDTVAKSTTMTIGSTTTGTTPPTVEATSMAAPAMKGSGTAAVRGAGTRSTMTAAT